MEKPDLGAPDLRIHYVRVTNNLEVTFSDRYDGIPVSIPPGKSDNLQLDMAGHFFGYHYEATRETMFRHVCKRQGWNTIDFLKVQESGKTLAQERFDKIDIRPVVYKMVEQPMDLDAPIPADPEPTGPDERPIAPVRKGAKAGAQ